MGGPGCGKGTQCKYMATKYGLCHVGLGQLLRQEAQRGTQRGRQIHDLMRQGLLVPTGIVLDMVSDNMLSHPESRGFLIDGFPRELKQAQEFERIGPGGAPGGRRGAGHPAAPGDALHPVRARPDLLPAEEPAAKHPGRRSTREHLCQVLLCHRKSVERREGLGARPCPSPEPVQEGRGASRDLVLAIFYGWLNVKDPNFERKSM
ncbi:uncharacterized protein LOC105869668 isoform X3 [Microcebus murinus]|nr:adenylate kinase isoenzyme 1-like isoform X3 [Microcebus murinus]XP_012617133.1 adenylate kinase isoenzyme 1-like isoform X3 [Microcebus murinus]